MRFRKASTRPRSAPISPPCPGLPHCTIQIELADSDAICVLTPERLV
jgi:hypothetical protein